MEEEKVDKSIVTLPVPKRFRGQSKSREVQWHEFKLKTRLMPNGYRVTLAVIIMLNCSSDKGRCCGVLGASACSPYDKFSSTSAHQRALGRARQVAFEYLYESTRKVRHTLFYDHNLGGDCSVETFEPGTSLTDVLRAVHDGTDAPTNSLYELVANNAEQNALIHECSILRREFGYRFDITVSN